MFEFWTPGLTLEEIEKQAILKAYAFYHKNKTHTAQALGIALRTLDNKFEKYEAERIAQEKRDEAVRLKDESFYYRQRGLTPPSLGAEGSHMLPRPATGIRMESAINNSAKPSVSVSVGKEVQGVLSSATAKSGAKRTS